MCWNDSYLMLITASQVAQRKRICLPMWELQETWVGSLGREDPLEEDPLEEGMAPHSRSLVWRILWTEEPGGLQSMELKKSQIRLK